MCEVTDVRHALPPHTPRTLLRQLLAVEGRRPDVTPRDAGRYTKDASPENESSIFKGSAVTADLKGARSSC